MKYSGTH